MTRGYACDRNRARSSCPSITSGSTSRSRRRNLRLGVTGEVNLGTLGQQTLPTVLTAAGKTGAAGLCAHARAKSVLPFAGALRALKSAFHKAMSPRRRVKSDYLMDEVPVVNPAGSVISGIATAPPFWNKKPQ